MPRRGADDQQGEPAIFISRAAAAARFGISVDTFDVWLKDKFLPGPVITRGGIVRWHWPTLERAFVGGEDRRADEYMTGVRRA